MALCHQGIAPGDMLVARASPGEVPASPGRGAEHPTLSPGIAPGRCLLCPWGNAKSIRGIKTLSIHPPKNALLSNQMLFLFLLTAFRSSPQQDFLLPGGIGTEDKAGAGGHGDKVCGCWVSWCCGGSSARVKAGAGAAGRVQLFHIRPGRPWLLSVLWEPGAESPVLNLRNRCRTTGTSLDHKWPLK